MKKLLLIALLFCIKQLNAQCPVTIGGDTIICTGITTTLTAYGATSYTWQPSGSNASFIAITPTTTTVYMVTGTTGTCTATNTISVTVKPIPTVDPIPPSFYCPNQVTNQINFTCQPAGGTPVFTYTVPGGISQTGTGSVPPFITINNTTSTLMTTFTVNATLNNCTGPNSIFSITTYPNPVARFGYNGSVCDGSPMQFTDESFANGGLNINTWAWDFNSDGSIDAANKNPSYIFPAGYAGTNSVTLLVGTNSVPSCTAQVTEQVYVNPNPVANFVGDSLKGCSVLQTIFTDQSTVTYPSHVSSWNWNFGNGHTTVSQFPPLQVYKNASTTQNVYYSVSLTVRTDSGCVSTITKTNDIEVLACANNGIEKYNGSTEANIYPNPNNGNFTIETTSTEKQTLQLVDVTGKLVLQQTITGKTNIDVSSLDNGIYFVQINTSEGFFTKKIIVQR
jgi:PKD repeat protein